MRGSDQLGHELIRFRVQAILQGKVSEEASPNVVNSEVLDEAGKVVGFVRVFLSKLMAAIKNFVSDLKKQGASEETVNAVEEIAQAVAKKIRENAADARRLDPYGVAYDARGATDTTAEEDAGAEESAGGGGVGASQQGGAVQPGGNAAASGNQQGGGAVQKGAGVGGVPGNDAELSAARQELERLKADLARAQGEKDELLRKKEIAEARRKLDVHHAGNVLADFEQVLAKVPEDARAQVAEILKKAVPGRGTHVVGVNGKRYPASYVAFAPGVVQTSHLPGDGFAINPNYAGENTRKYHSDEAEQNKVREIAKPGALDEGLAVSNTTGAETGPVMDALVIDADEAGNPRVRIQSAGGNGRQMAMDLAQADDQNRISDEWQAQADTYGFKNLPDGYHGARFMGVFDFRKAGERERYQELVDALNPSSGNVPEIEARVQIDAANHVSAGAISDASLDFSGEQAVNFVNALLKATPGLDKKLMNSVVKSPSSSQLYVQHLIMAGAFRSPVISQFYFDLKSVSGGATAKGLVKAAAQAAIELRMKGGAEFADAIAGTLAEVITYTKQGQSIASAIGNAAQQALSGPAGRIVQSIATALENKVAFREQNKNGTRPVNTEATIENFNELFEDIARAVGNFNAEPDLLGETDTLDATLARALAANARRTQEYQATPAVASQAPRSDSTRRDTRRLRDLLNQQREEGLNRWEQAELDTLEKKAGQNFMQFFEDVKTQPRFTLEQQETGGRPAQAEQLALLSRTASPSKPWPAGFPDIAIHTTISKLKSHPDYIAAKAGDPIAAVKVAAAAVKPEVARKLAGAHPGSILASVHAQEASGRNQLPLAMAARIGELTGLDVDSAIFQSNIVGHTGATAASRLSSVPDFAGQVHRGRDYILIDDVATSGSSLAAMRSYIEEKGGRVVAATTFATTSNPQTGYGGYLAIKAETVAALKKKFDPSELDAILRSNGIAESAAGLTNSQGKYLLTFATADRIRSAITGAEQKGQSEGDAGLHGGEKASDLAQQSEFRLSEEAAQQYLDFHNVPTEKQAEGKKAIAQARKASKKPYSIPAGRGLDRDGQQRARERQAEAYRGLKENKPELLKKAFQEGIPVSSLLADFVNREIPSFDIRGAVIESAEDFAAFALPHRSPVFESLKVAVLDNRSQVIHSQIVHVGSLNETPFGVREILSVVNTAKARNPKIPIQGFVISHNHPSGETKPSNADTRATTILEQAADSIGVPMIDHIITNGKNYFSYRESGIIAGRSGKTLPGKLRQPQREKPAADLAEWQAIPNEARVVLADGRAVQTVADTLKTADPDHVHAIFCDTQSRVLSVNRYPIDQHGLYEFRVAPVARDAASATANFVFLSLPKKAGASRVDAKAFLTRAAMQFKQLNVTLHDAQLPDGQLAREVNLMEDPATFQNDMAEQSRFFTKKATEAGLQSADAADLRQWTKWAEEWRASNPRQEAATPAVASRTARFDSDPIKNFENALDWFGRVYPKQKQAAGRTFADLEATYGKPAVDAMRRDVQALQAVAERAKPGFDAAMQKVATAFGGEMTTAGIKGELRAVDKTLDKRRSAGELKDLVRATIVVDTPEQAKAVADYVRKNFTLLEPMEDRFAEPTSAGYMDAIAVIKLGSVNAELQVSIPEMMAAKEVGHRPYEIIRGKGAMVSDTEDAMMRESLNFAMRSLYAAALAANRFRSSSAMRAQSLSARSLQPASSNSLGGALRANASGLSGISSPAPLMQKSPASGSSTTGSPSSAKNFAPGGNSAGIGNAFIDPSIQPGGESDNGKPAITAQNVKEFTGTLAVSPNALPESGMWNVFDRTKFDAAEGAEVVPVSQLISRKDERQDPKYKAGTKGFPVANAYKFMLQSQQGRSEKGGREPLTVTRNADGTFEILDGNSTAQVLMLAGWKSVPVSVQGATQSAGTLDQILEREGGTIEAQLSPASRTAFHGTPYSFDRFMLEKVGTGEGNQTYGWGLYFAENPKVANGYARDLINRAPIQWDGQPYDPSNPRHRAGVAMRIANGDRSAALAKVADESVANALRNREEATPREQGNTYTVDLDVEPEELADWDKGFSEQPEKVRAALGEMTVGKERDADVLWSVKLGEDYVGGFMTKREAQAFADNGSLSQIYRYLAGSKGPGNVSREWARKGIAGVQYLDQGSRVTDGHWKKPYFDSQRQSWAVENTGGEIRTGTEQQLVEFAERKNRENRGTYNYVIFDEAKIQITHRNGDPIEQTPMARAPRFDPNQIDIFGGNTLTAPPAPSKGAATNENKPAKPRRNNDPLGIGNGELLLPGLHSDSQGSGAPTGVDPEQFDLFAGGNATARPGRPGSGGAGGDVIGGGSAGDGTLGATEAGAAGSDREGVSGDVRDNGNAAGEPAKLERPPEGSPDRNARIDPSRSYAPKQGRARFDANITAIQLMRKLEAEGRNATTAEKETLLTYTGWGWLKGAFNAVNAAKWKQNEEQIRSFYTAAKDHCKEFAFAPAAPETVRTGTGVGE